MPAYPEQMRENVVTPVLNYACGESRAVSAVSQGFDI